MYLTCYFGLNFDSNFLQIWSLIAFEYFLRFQTLFISDLISILLWEWSDTIGQSMLMGKILKGVEISIFIYNTFFTNVSTRRTRHTTLLYKLESKLYCFFRVSVSFSILTCFLLSSSRVPITLEIFFFNNTIELVFN